MIEKLNAIGENVWAVLLIFLGAGLAITGLHNQPLLGVGETVIGIGAIAFKGSAAPQQ